MALMRSTTDGELFRSLGLVFAYLLDIVFQQVAFLFAHFLPDRIVGTLTTGVKNEKKYKDRRSYAAARIAQGVSNDTDA